MSGHGWVIPNPSGVVARCGGPALCSVCQEEQRLGRVLTDQEEKELFRREQEEARRERAERELEALKKAQEPVKLDGNSIVVTLVREGGWGRAGDVLCCSVDPLTVMDAVKKMLAELELLSQHRTLSWHESQSRQALERIVQERETT